MAKTKSIIKPAFREISKAFWWQHCQRDPGADIDPALEATHCSCRPVAHCWHVVENRDLPICCYCEKTGHLGRTGYIQDNLFHSFLEIIHRNFVVKTSGPIDGQVMKIVGDVRYPGSNFPYAIETTDIRSGLRRLYMRNSYSGAEFLMSQFLRHLGILNYNLEALKTGKIPHEFRAEAIQEIQNQLGFFPSTRTITEEREVKDHYADQAARQFRALTRSKPAQHKKAGKSAKKAKKH
ncbi:MAG: hypothetical protein JXA73_00230 [Acidobacteria bacterium]|nr:hypothetical protein [Acidobacteriota bacterium]